MPDSAANPDLLRSLGQLARGLSALFWGLPLALILCIQTGRVDSFRSFGMLPALLSLALLLYGVRQMGHFQPQERPWRLALDRAQLVALINLGLSPFLYWWSRLPEPPLFGWAVALLAVCGVLFLYNLNLVLQRLGAMLPDETLRQESRQFTVLNRGLLLALLLLGGLHLSLTRLPDLPFSLLWLVLWLDRFSVWLLVPLLLMPLATTMALLWKAKEVVLESVFHTRH